MIICVNWFELFSQVSDVAHGPFVSLNLPPLNGWNTAHAAFYIIYEIIQLNFCLN